LDNEKSEMQYCLALGPKPLNGPTTLDFYRYKLIYKQLCPGSVLDIGAYYTDFLQIARKNGRQIFGTEVNQGRREFSNSILGENLVVVDFQNGRLRTFQDSSIDNVVCMEVIEHIVDDKVAVSELCRVARKKVVITVPFREKIRFSLCVNCNKFTPHSGHLHSYDLDSFSKLVPDGWQVTRVRPICNRMVRFLMSILPNNAFIMSVVKWFDFIRLDTGKWMKVILEPIKR
jgi:SAM-dependent methyltransferase